MRDSEKFSQKNLVVIPTYNEFGNIKELFDKINSYLPDIHILVVDDNSRDGTSELVKRYVASNPERIHLIQRSGKLGLASAYITGFKWALERGYDTITEMDADLSHDPYVLTRITECLKSEYVVIGSRYVDGGGTVNWSFIRKMISRFGSLYARLILGMKTRDLTGGFNGWRREVLEAVDLDTIKSEGYSFQIELKYRAHKKGYKIKEIPIIFSDRRVGESKMSSRIVLEAMYRVWGLRCS
ncbi:MAG: polyprenol monophosphomannose synthase [Oligoflexales bacterium]|nr:polyprenol monophosphomannose synthase [Oligoflexales bacterium]